MLINRKHCSGRQRNSQQGYTLIEVVIGILVLSIGILGMATMQISSKRLSHDAMQRSVATMLMHDMIERMRANHLAVGDQPGMPAPYKVASVGTSSPSTPTPTPAAEPTSCMSPNVCEYWDLAAHDLWEWEQELNGVNEMAGANNAGGLVYPRGCIDIVDGLVTITITWKGFQTLGNPSPTITCGTGLGLYGTGDEERQLITMTTFINYISPDE